MKPKKVSLKWKAMGRKWAPIVAGHREENELTVKLTKVYTPVLNACPICGNHIGSDECKDLEAPSGYVSWLNS